MRLVAALLVASLLPGCGGDERDELLVSAAASLADAFIVIEAAFEEDHPDVDVVLNVAGSATLRHQILEAAPADVFASADLANMDQVVAAGLTLGEPVVFALNRLQIAVPSSNPAGVAGITDLADERLYIGLCAVGVPCGDYARDALRRAGVTPSTDTNEPDVRFLIAKIETGELDAGITFVTDVIAAGGSVEGIDIPEEFDVVAEYPIVALADSTDPSLAAAFVDFVLSAEGQEILANYGFGPP